MRNSLSAVKTILAAALTFLILSQCTEDEIAPSQTAAGIAEITPIAEVPTGSFTISGIHTLYESVDDCSTCTFVVPADLAEIDGAKLNLKPGSVICLDGAIKYGDIIFTNLEGTEEQPIVIGTCGAK